MIRNHPDLVFLGGRQKGDFYELIGSAGLRQEILIQVCEMEKRGEKVAQPGKVVQMVLAILRQACQLEIKRKELEDHFWKVRERLRVD